MGDGLFPRARAGGNPQLFTMTHSQKRIIAFLSIIAAVLTIGLGTYTLRTYRAFAAQPLGPALPVEAHALPATWTASPGPDSVQLTTSTPMVAATLLPTISFPTNTPPAVCGGLAPINILVIGADSRVDSYLYGLADAVRIVRVDFSIPRVTILEFPRDLWVYIPHIADNLNGQDHEKLNQAYLYGQPGFKYWDHPSQGSGLLALTLNENFGVQVNHYAAVNMRTFVNIVNAVDGIDITIPDKQTADSTGLPIGDHHLNGDQTLKVVRSRRSGDFERTDNQNLVMCALRKKLTNPNVVTQIPELIESFKNNIRTDLSPAQLSQMACVGTKLEPKNIVFVSFPQELFKQGRVYDPVFDKRIYILDADFDVMRDYVARFQAGTWPLPLIGIPSSPGEEPPLVCE
jgi:LCP family protein required for cell wall assembly